MVIRSDISERELMQVGSRWQSSVAMAHLQPQASRENYMVPMLEMQSIIMDTENEQHLFVGDFNATLPLKEVQCMHGARFQHVTPDPVTTHAAVGSHGQRLTDWMCEESVQWGWSALRRRCLHAGEDAGLRQASSTVPSSATSTALRFAQGAHARRTPRSSIAISVEGCLFAASVFIECHTGPQQRCSAPGDPQSYRTSGGELPL